MPQTAKTALLEPTDPLNLLVFAARRRSRYVSKMRMSNPDDSCHDTCTEVSVECAAEHVLRGMTPRSQALEAACAPSWVLSSPP